MQKLSINLLQDELIPQKPLWTLQLVVILWFISLTIMTAWMISSEYKLQERSAGFNTANQLKTKQDSYLTELENKVRKNKASPVLQEKLETVKLLLLNKKSLHGHLTDASSTYAAGFSTAMTELSELHHKDVSLQHVQMSANNMVFSGLARKPEAVPAWLAAFENSTFLSGHSFSHFSLSENEQKVMTFTVSSQPIIEQTGS